MLSASAVNAQQALLVEHVPRVNTTRSNDHMLNVSGMVRVSLFLAFTLLLRHDTKYISAATQDQVLQAPGIFS